MIRKQYPEGIDAVTDSFEERSSKFVNLLLLMPWNVTDVSKSFLIVNRLKKIILKEFD